MAKPKLLIIELWGLGDLAIASPFARKACEQFDVTLLAKPFALELQPWFWPDVKVIPFQAPWTAFKGKYHLWSWPWSNIFSIRKKLRQERFDVAVSARWGDPRDHFLLKLTKAEMRLGFPRGGNRMFLTHPLNSPDHASHRYENWRVIAKSLNVNLEPRAALDFPRRDSRTILVHTGAAQPVRVWPLERYRQLVQKLRQRGETVKVLCNPDQKAWWNSVGEPDALAPQSVEELVRCLDEGRVFVGNDSGPGHLAALRGLPTFTIFGPQVVEWAPLHPAAEWIEGKACPYKPCSDYCRFPTPHCLWNITEAEVWDRLSKFVERHLHPNAVKNLNRSIGTVT